MSKAPCFLLITAKLQYYPFLTIFLITTRRTPKVVSVGCVGLWKHNGVLSEFGKIRETGKMCHVMSVDE